MNVNHTEEFQSNMMHACNIDSNANPVLDEQSI